MNILYNDILSPNMLPKKNYAIMESKVYEERNGQVIKDKYIKETIADNKMEVEGYDNGRPIYYVKDLGKSMNNQLAMPRRASRKSSRKSSRKTKAIKRKSHRAVKHKSMHKSVRR